MVLPFAPGGGTDTTLRPIVDHMAQTLGQQVLFEYKPGGGGMVAGLYVKSAPPDGYTIYHVASTAIIRSLGDNPPVNILRDFSFISPNAGGALVVVVHPGQVKARTLKELIEESRVNPGQLNYASYGTGTAGHMLAELLANEAKVKWVHVPYQGTAQAATETVAGRTQITFLGMATLGPFVAADGGAVRLRMLAVSTAERWPLNPDVPGMKESGFPQIDFQPWSGFIGPAGMPGEVVNRLNQAVSLAHKDPKVIEVYRKLQLIPVSGTPEDMRRRVEAEYRQFNQLIKDSGIKLE